MEHLCRCSLVACSEDDPSQQGIQQQGAAKTTVKVGSPTSDRGTKVVESSWNF
jgi:hypothetical protein